MPGTEKVLSKYLENTYYIKLMLLSNCCDVCVCAWLRQWVRWERMDLQYKDPWVPPLTLSQAKQVSLRLTFLLYKVRITTQHAEVQWRSDFMILIILILINSYQFSHLSKHFLCILLTIPHNSPMKWVIFTSHLTDEDRRFREVRLLSLSAPLQSEEGRLRFTLKSTVFMTEPQTC